MNDPPTLGGLPNHPACGDASVMALVDAGRPTAPVTGDGPNVWALPMYWYCPYTFSVAASGGTAGRPDTMIALDGFRSVMAFESGDIPQHTPNWSKYAVCT